MSEDRFDWDNDDTIIIRSVRPVAVDRNRYNEIVIRQENVDPHDEDHFIHVPQSELRKLIDALQNQVAAN